MRVYNCEYSELYRFHLILYNIVIDIIFSFFRKTSDMQRLQFFNDSLVYLSVAATKGFQAFTECASLIKDKLRGFPLDLSHNGRELKLDTVSMDIFPSQEFPDLVPIKVSGDGNCLPRSASMLVFGDQQHHVEMRVRLACELALNKDYYLNNDNHKMYEFDTFSYCSTITTYSSSFKPGMDISVENINKVFERDTMNTAKRGSFCGIWHLYGLASIVGCRLYSIYPKLRSTVTIRPELNRIIFPRKQISKRRLAIFWTNTHGVKDANFWSPNHFSPCFPKHFLLDSKQKSICELKTEADENQFTTQCIGKMVTTPRSRSLTPCRQKVRPATPVSRHNTPKKHCRTPRKNTVRFNIESTRDLAMHLVAKHSKKIQIKSLNRGKNPLKSIVRFFLGHHRGESRGPDVSFYEIESTIIN